MLYNYDNFTYMQYRIRHLEEKARSLESGDAFVRMKKGQDNMRRYYERRISGMQRELEQAHKETACTREKWFEVFQDVQDECRKPILPRPIPPESAKQQREDKPKARRPARP